MARADDWGAWNDFKTQSKLDQRMGDDTQGISDDLEAFLGKNTKLGPLVGSIALDQSARAKRSLKQNDEAMTVYDQGLARYKEDPGITTLVWGKAELLLQSDKAPEAQKLVEAHWPSLVAAARSESSFLSFATRGAVEQYIAALEAQGKGAADPKAGRDQIIAGLQKTLLEMPIYLDGSKQAFNAWNTGWMYEKLVANLLAQDRAPEALSWSALYFRTGAFKDFSVNHATAQLNRAWAATEEFNAPRLFTRAQEAPVDGAAPVANPLVKVALPTQDAKVATPLKARLNELLKQALSPTTADAETLLNASEEEVSIRLALNTPADTLEALNVARTYLRAYPDAPDGALLVCRVFKAFDGNSRRANAFVAYLNGQGDNPLPAFQKEVSDTK